MPKAPPTRPSLLLRLRDHQDHQAWGQFVEIYAPLIYGYFRKHGLQDADAADLTQACLRQVAVHVGSLVHDRCGAFRSWLFTIVRNKLRNFLAQPHRLRQGTGDSRIEQLLQEQPSREADEADEWKREHRRSLLAWAAEQVKPQVQQSAWQAFWLTAVEGVAVRDAAARLGCTTATVYLARSRIMARLRAVIREVQEDE